MLFSSLALVVMLAAGIPALAQANRTAVCHKPGTPAAHTIVPANQSVLQAHLRHGDTRGPCQPGQVPGPGGGGAGGGGAGGDGAAAAPFELTQETEQEAESGEVTQTFEVTSTGDNSNQCVGIQGVGNTGNAQNLTGVIQYGSDADDFEFEEVGSTIDVSPTSTTTCDQQVNQAATAAG